MRLTTTQVKNLVSGNWTRIPLTGEITQPFGDNLPGGLELKFYSSSEEGGITLKMAMQVNDPDGGEVDEDVGELELETEDFPDLDINVRELEAARASAGSGDSLMYLMIFAIAEVLAPSMLATVHVVEGEGGGRKLIIRVAYGEHHEDYDFPGKVCRALFGVDNLGRRT